MSFGVWHPMCGNANNEAAAVMSPRARSMAPYIPSHALLNWQFTQHVALSELNRLNFCMVVGDYSRLVESRGLARPICTDYAQSAQRSHAVTDGH